MRTWKALIALLMVACLGLGAAATWAQSGGDDRPGAGPRPLAPPPREALAPGVPGQGGPMMPGGPGGGPGGRGPVGGPQPWPGMEGMAPMMAMARMMHEHLSLVHEITRIADDPTACAVAAVMQAQDLLAPRGSDAVIAFYTKLEGKVKNQAVQRAIRMHLIEAYKKAGQTDKALEELQTQILSAQ